MLSIVNGSTVANITLSQNKNQYRMIERGPQFLYNFLQWLKNMRGVFSVDENIYCSF